MAVATEQSQKRRHVAFRIINFAWKASRERSYFGRLEWKGKRKKIGKWVKIKKKVIGIGRKAYQRNISRGTGIESSRLPGFLHFSRGNHTLKEWMLLLRRPTNTHAYKHIVVYRRYTTRRVSAVVTRERRRLSRVPFDFITVLFRW